LLKGRIHKRLGAGGGGGARRRWVRGVPERGKRGHFPILPCEGEKRSGKCGSGRGKGGEWKKIGGLSLLGKNRKCQHLSIKPGDRR